MPDGALPIVNETEIRGTFRDGCVQLDGPVDWTDGARVLVRLAPPEGDEPVPRELGPVIVAGFGLAGRWIADIFERHGIEYVVVEKNADVVAAQRSIGRAMVEGDIACEETLRRAGVERASMLALTIPDEDAVLRATEVARRLKPDIYIVARTTHSSAGMEAARLGANHVIKAEQTVARQFHDMLLRRLGMRPPPATAEVDLAD